MLPAQLKALGLSDKPNITARFEECLKTLWTSNGDNVSRMYAGTGALDAKTKVQCPTVNLKFLDVTWCLDAGGEVNGWCQVSQPYNSE